MRSSMLQAKEEVEGGQAKIVYPRLKLANEPPLEAGVTLYIEDNGPGIEKDDMERVFERGYRGRQAQGKINGNGLV